MFDYSGFFQQLLGSREPRGCFGMLHSLIVRLPVELKYPQARTLDNGNTDFLSRCFYFSRWRCCWLLLLLDLTNPSYCQKQYKRAQKLVCCVALRSSIFVRFSVLPIRIVWSDFGAYRCIVEHGSVENFGPVFGFCFYFFFSQSRDFGVQYLPMDPRRRPKS